MVKTLKILIVISALVVVTGCQHEKDDLSAYVSTVKSQQKADIPPLPVLKAYEKYSYNASELRSPFVRTVVEMPLEIEQPIVEDNGIHPDKHRRKEALEFYDLASLQLMGTLEKETVWALIRSSDGVIHRAQIGNYMGRNHGKILSISEMELKLKEIVAEGDGRYMERDSSLSIADVN
ncbi:pilus assembly protein PilP [Methylophaga sp. 42_8_T64]|nr:pilus assembly protein PilP [Methylophaga sp. 41_12_T18]OUR86233.1 pilus assembly protein PilP [Methylophaga sp. 42_8_T64]